MKTSMRRNASRRVGAFALAATMPLTTAIVLGTAPAAATPAQPGGCPDLMMYGIQGTGQSSPDADPGVDTGFLGTVLSAALQEAQGTVDRAYIPYAGSFGGTGPSTPGQNASYMDSVMGAVATGEQWITDKVAECPDIHIGLAGFSQGAHAVRLLMQAILDGKLPIDPSKVALVANFGDPTRPAGASIFPDAPGQTTPDPVPGTSGAMVRQLMTTALSPEGGGIGPTADIASEIGELAGRYFSMCSSGDMTCDSPASAPLAHTVANIAGQLTLDPGDPIKSAETIAKALAFTTIKTIVPVINEDLQGTTLQNLSYRPEVSIGQRLAAASDPRTPLPNISDAVNALFKIGTIGLNAAITVGKQLLAPDTIAAIAAAGATNPVAILGIVGAKLGQAAITLIPPSTANRLVKEAFTTFKTNFTENSDLLSVTSLMKYWDSAAAHNSYGLDSVTPSGDPSTSFVAKWIAAAGMDIAGISDGGDAATTEVGTPPTFDIPTDGTTTTPVEGEMGQLGALTGLLPGADSTVVAESSTPSVSAEPTSTEAPYTPN
ncbi:cutinase family protein [Skermania sp. ID1734]|uniref:cutinase family protein n=1 Tax=Skermania sp. ID1734 TaxID=2597516 RepID=UPI00163DAE26|nr:cutinase family protein [Skermania sp. ID1734]